MKEQKNDGFSIASSWGMVVVACPAPKPGCKLRRYIAENPTVAKTIETPGDDVISLRTLGKTNEIANKTPILYDVAKELCEFCLQQQKQK